jgi:hypothetical protein
MISREIFSLLRTDQVMRYLLLNEVNNVFSVSHRFSVKFVGKTPELKTAMWLAVGIKGFW